MNSMQKNRQMIRRVAVTAILSALVILLQMIATFLPIGSVSITLSLIPIVLGAVLYGPAVGAFLGLVLGAIILAIDPTAQSMMFLGGANTAWPAIVTVLLCLVKSTAAGFTSGLIARLLQKANRPRLAVVLASIACPTVNSGIFAIFVPIFFYDMIAGWAPDASNVISFFLLMVVGFNYLLELTFNLVLTPTILRVISIIKKKL